MSGSSGKAAGLALSLFDAKGDLPVATADDIVTRLPVGTNGQVLTADSAQTKGMKWATPAASGMATDTLWDAKGDLGVGTGADAASKLAVGADGQVPSADSSQATGLKYKWPSRAVSTLTAPVTVVNSAVLSTLWSVALPTTLVAGDVLSLVVWGDHLNSSGGGLLITWTFTIGATVVVTTTAISAANNVNARLWRFECFLVVVGTSDERFSVWGESDGSNATPSNLIWGSGNNTGLARGTAAEDLTAGKNLLVQTTMDTANANASVTLREGVLLVSKA